MSHHRLPDFSQHRIAVAGDVMLDRYWYGQTARISPEAPVPVVRVNGRESRPGGAANVAINLTSLGCQVRLMGQIGDDDNGQSLLEQCQRAGIECFFASNKAHPTCTKLRVMSRNQQLIRLDFEQPPEPLSTASASLNRQQIDARLRNAKVCILSDYGKGMLQNANTWIASARAASIPILVDPKGHDFARYRGATLLTPNQKEFELVVGDCHNDENRIIAKAEQTLSAHNLTAILITRGADGMLLVSRDGPAVRLPAVARDVFDVTGAGDTVIATLAAFMSTDASLAQAAEWANFAAGCVVAKLGTASITREELATKATVHQAPPLRGVISLKEAQRVITAAKQQQQKIVFTNGCFDLLHAGHVHYLQQAKRFGDKLIVAINDDDSVRRLKGEGRPITPCRERMQVIAGLDAVDWVVSFSEDTPLNIIKTLCPDILVKGGDYTAASIVGADVVLAKGGQVKSLDFVQGLSTSQTIAKINHHGHSSAAPSAPPQTQPIQPELEENL